MCYVVDTKTSVFMRISHKSNAVLPIASLKINFSKLMCVFKKSEIVDFLDFLKAS